jgi:hypothetical protein
MTVSEGADPTPSRSHNPEGGPLRIVGSITTVAMLIGDRSPERGSELSSSSSGLRHRAVSALDLLSATPAEAVLLGDLA